ncbi:MAG: hypothetical protein LBU60_02695 [Clostridiales bacterium]|nr:hypothetical protein [Clostridiales bacterium]
MVTKFSLKKEQNAGGITFSKVVVAMDRELSDQEKQSILPMVEQVKSLSKTMQQSDND